MGCCERDEVDIVCTESANTHGVEVVLASHLAGAVGNAGCAVFILALLIVLCASYAALGLAAFWSWNEEICGPGVEVNSEGLLGLADGSLAVIELVFFSGFDLIREGNGASGALEQTFG